MLRWVVVVVALAGAAFRLYIWLGVQPGDPLATDYKTFFIASRMADAAVYEGPRHMFIYPPTVIPWLEVLENLDFWTGYLVLSLASVAAFSWVVNRLAGWRAAALSIASMPAVWGLVLGQTAMLLTAGLLFALSLPESRKGFVIGILAAVKPQLFVAAPFVFIVRREWFAFAGMAAGGVSAVLLSLALFGFAPWAGWLGFLANSRDYFQAYGVTDATVTVAGQANASGLAMLPFVALGVAVATWAVLQSKGADPVTLAAIIGGASIVASPYALPHDCVVVIPAIVAALLARPSLRSAPAVGVYAGTLLPITLPLLLSLLRVNVTGRTGKPLGRKLSSAPSSPAPG